jgi:membrane associated rhomboid family serine protease
MIPLKDNIKSNIRPWGVITACIVLTSVSILVWLNDKDGQLRINYRFGFTPLELAVNPWISFLKTISATFLHGDIFHLTGNCLFLWVFGCSLERLFGSKEFLFLFPFLGISGFLLQWILQPNSYIPVIGASAAISTLLGAYFALFPKAQVKSLLILGWFIRVVDLPAWIFLIYWIGLQIFEVTLGSTKVDSVAYGAHIGGFILGAIGAIIWKVAYPEAEEKILNFTGKNIPPVKLTK